MENPANFLIDGVGKEDCSSLTECPDSLHGKSVLVVSSPSCCEKTIVSSEKEAGLAVWDCPSGQWLP